MRISEYDFQLPQGFIAQYPSEKREHSKLMILHRKSESIEHKTFYQIIDYLNKSDGLVINQTRIFPARLFGKLENRDSKIEILLLKKIEDDMWEILVKPGRKAKIGQKIVFDENKLSCQILDRSPAGGRVVRFFYDADFHKIVEEIGVIPLPPYIKREPEIVDKKRYQTVYAKEIGAVAGPTAGFHFTDELLKKIEGKGIVLIPIVLHVGLGTFRPIKVDDPSQHRMEAEYFKMDESSARKIKQVRENGGKIFAVGTSVVRTLETVARQDNILEHREGWTDIFIYPPYQFKLVDAILTNFHLPKSTLLLLVSAFSNKDLIFKAYQEAIDRKYRFYSYGDAMLII
ncbi:MAG: tRNA preQ1(34) S-adenosylmethionine ribosyltransferase-isomerase QueA [Candidatus Zixiibacteriota bacterium]